MTSDVADLWDAEAACFDEQPDHGLADPSVRNAWSALLRRQIPYPSSSVLDLGCGTGSLAVLLAEWGHQVTGVSRPSTSFWRGTSAGMTDHRRTL